MQSKVIKKGICQVCKKEKNMVELVPSSLIRESVRLVIQHDNKDWESDSFICYNDLNHYRNDHIGEILEKEKGELNELEIEVVRSIKEQELLSENINAFETRVSFGDSTADTVAAFGGSWRFIIIFGVIMLVWIMVNTILIYVSKPFDPYPYILLNLMLSCLAAMQAPIIMMSQNRQEAKDRLRSQHEYKVNLKAELEIRHLQEKLDYQINHQWNSLLEVQQMQVEMLNEIMLRNYQTRKEDRLPRITPLPDYDETIR